MQFKCSVGQGRNYTALGVHYFCICTGDCIQGRLKNKKKHLNNGQRKLDCCTYYFRHVSAKGVKTFARLSTPQFAGLIEGAGGNLISKFD